MEIPAVIKILVVFAGVLALSRCRVELGIGLILGGVALDFWGGRGFSEVAADMGVALSRPTLWLLLVITALILELGRFMAEEKNAQALMGVARKWGGSHGRAASLMFLPAVIGLVPMPGGALISAPLVQQTVDEPEWSAEWKVAVNYWFRHAWEYWWPLFPVVIVTLSIFELETWRFMVWQLPYSVTAILSGYVFLVRPHLDRLRDNESNGSVDRGQTAMVLLPLFVIAVAVLVLPSVMERLTPQFGMQVNKLLAMLIGMIIGLGMIFWHERDSKPKLIKTVMNRKTARILITLAGVMIFQSMLNASGLLPVAGEEFVASGIPLVLIVALLPFVAGMVTGIAIGFAGTSFPLVAGMITAEGSGISMHAALVLAFGFGYAGMMLSPVHLCFVLTREYFSASFRRVYRQILPCIFVLLVTSVVLYIVLQLLA